MSLESKFPDKTHIEMQQELLRGLHREISERLFVSGVASRIVGAKPPTRGAKTDTEGLAQLDKIFVPTFNKKQVDGRNERVLRLAVITEGPNSGRSFGYTTLGEIDEQGFMHVFEGIPEDDAWAVLNEATELEKLRTGDGENPPTLPGLDYSMLNINNPYTGIQKMPDKPQL